MRCDSSSERVFFFFQAEDGIRGVAVTGVQTCALPISTGVAVGQVVIPLDQLGPQPALAAALDHPQLQWCELPRASFQNGLWSARLAQSNAARSLRSRIPYRRQRQPALVAQAFPDWKSV